jgi:tetratricopeptide (TPR) repeat protein
MNDTPSVAELLGQQLRQNDYDLFDIVPIPATADRDVRLRTLEEALHDFDGDANSGELQQYLVQVKPKRSRAPQQDTSAVEAENQQVYLPDGSLNIPYLQKNAELLVGCGEYALAKNIYLRIAQAGQSATHASRALYALGTCFEAEGNLEEARSRFEQSITFQPTLETYQRLANLLIQQKKERPAAETLERALNLKELSHPTRFELLKTAGGCWMRAGELAAAERTFKKALEVEPSADGIQASLGTLYLQAGKFSEARRKFQDTLAANARNHKAIAGLGMCHLQDGNKREAHDHFARALDIDLVNPQTVYHLVKCAYELKSYATAARVVENYIQVAPVNINLMYSLAGLQFHLGRIGDATATLQQILDMNPSHTGAKDLLHRIEAMNGN